MQIDCIDLYQIHWPQRNVPMFGATEFDPAKETGGPPIGEQVEGMAAMIKAGKIRHYGLSNETAWGVCEFRRVARELGVPGPVTIQNSYSLVSRGVDNDLAETLFREKMSLLAYSPLGGGILAGKYLGGAQPPGARFTLFDGWALRFRKPIVHEAVEAYAALAKRRGISLVQLALGYVRSRWYLGAIDHRRDDDGAARGGHRRRRSSSSMPRRWRRSPRCRSATRIRRVERSQRQRRGSAQSRNGASDAIRRNGLRAAAKGNNDNVITVPLPEEAPCSISVAAIDPPKRSSAENAGQARAAARRRLRAAAASPRPAVPPDPAPRERCRPIRRVRSGQRCQGRPALVPGGTERTPARAVAHRTDLASGRTRCRSADGEAPGSKLFVGVNIKLKGVEISDCDVLVVEGHVEATVHSKAMQIAKPGTLQGTALDRRRGDPRRIHRRAHRADAPRRARHRPGVGNDPLRPADRGRRRRDQRRREAARCRGRAAHPPRRHVAPAPDARAR